MKLKRFLGILMTALLFLLPIQTVRAETEPVTGYWKLKVTAVNQNDSVTEAMVQANSNIVSHNYEIHPGGGSMSTTLKSGDNNITIKSSHTFEAPEILVPGQTVSIRITAADAGSSNSNYYISHSTSAGKWINNGGRWKSYGEPLNAATGTFVTAQNPDKSLTQGEKTAEFIVPEKADAFTIHFSILGGSAPGPMVINYDYDYVEGDPAGAATTPTPSPSQSINPIEPDTKEPAPPTPSKYPSMKDYDNYIDYLASRDMLDYIDEDAGVVFSDLSGQVEVFVVDRDDPEGGQWEFAKIDKVLKTGMRIRTGLDSSAILSFADMSTFVMKPNTEIILSSPTQKENKLILAAGNIWANVKKMVKDGTMDIEMSYAAGGIRGTIFVCEEDGANSTLKVIEGKVKFTDKSTGDVTMVSGGEMITAGENATPLQDFNIQEEHASWESYAPGHAITNKSNTVWFIVAAVGGALLIAVILILIAVRRKKARYAPVYAAPGYVSGANKLDLKAAASFCSNCGNRIDAGSSFCSKCGNKIG
ncbi:MAG: FecR protein [Smithella sp. PtaU1.Bin162]|nr:MAG: FecR protein [Smithella sp. PtaU1.Bin162]